MQETKRHLQEVAAVLPTPDWLSMAAIELSQSRASPAAWKESFLLKVVGVFSSSVAAS